MNQDKIKFYCEACKKDVEPGWNERQVLDVVQDDEYGRDKYASDYQIICSECGYILSDWSDEE